MSSSGSLLLRVAAKAASKQFAAPKGRRNESSRHFAEVVARKQVSKEERAILRAARRERAAAVLQQSSPGAETAVGAAAGAHKQILASRWIWYGGLGIPVALLAWGMTDENSPPAKLAEAIGLTAYLQEWSDEYAKPVHDKLLPDWSQMPNVPQDIPIPHTLVLDFENTLVSSTWDRKYGWRHAKRPGVDKFLMDMAQYYEIVLYSPSLDLIDPAVTSLDKSGCIMHRLYRDATFFHNGFHVKDLKRLNRNINRIVVIDDDLDENQFHPQNVIRVKPYDDPSNQSDNTLARITPFLIEIAREGYDDIPTLLSQYEGMDADEIADENDRRVREFRHMREEKMSSGLGGFAKMARKTVEFEPELPPQESGFVPPAPQQLTSKDLVGAAPPSAAETSGLMGFLNRRQEEKEENTKRKFERWQAVMMRKQQEKEQAAKGN